MSRFNEYLEGAKSVYTLVWERKGIERETSGTLDELKKYFGYTLEAGNSWNPKINRNPKSIDALIKAINRSIDETSGGYDRPYVSLKQ
jgi:hypothetical protein